MANWSRRHTAVLAVFALFLQAKWCPPVDDLTNSVDKLVATAEQAVQTLGDQSVAWQDTLKNLQARLAADAAGLEGQIAEDVRGLITQIDTIAKDGVQFAQESVNCEIDFFRSHAKVTLQNLINALLNKYSYKNISNRAMLRSAPMVCSVNPNGVSLATWDNGTFLVLSGTDLSEFDTQRPTVVVRRKDGSEQVTADFGNRVTNYRYAINVPAMIAQNLLKDAIQLQVRWNGHQVNPNEIPVVPCGGFGQPCCRGQLCAEGSCANGSCGLCGQVGQACCNGQACQAGSCVSNVCTACGAIGQACCSGYGCNSGGQCSGNVCRPSQACVWTADFSEEGSAQGHCPSGFAMRGAKCRGSYCDNIALFCCPYAAGADGAATVAWSGWFSEEHGGQLYPETAAARFLSGLRCRGSYCDDLSMEFLTTPHLRFLGQCYRSPWFSEEGSGEGKCGANEWVGGMACRGSNCDDLSLFCCRGEPAY